MADLHITNGDGAANIIKSSCVSGDVLPWRDPMHHGPFPAGLDLDSVSKVRARYLGGADTESDEVGRDFQLRDAHLRAAADYDRVVLWFEHDLLDQLQILQLLDWFSGAGLRGTRLEMICIDAFAGVDPFRGIGQLDPEQMASLIDRRQLVSPAQLALAKAGWTAFCSAGPRDLETFMSGDLSALPFLHAALARHLEEYPWTHSGLTRTERQILSLVAKGVSDPGEIFLENMELESVYFIGDWPSYRHIGDLCAGADPLLHTASGEPYWSPPETRHGRDAFRRQRLCLTETGAQIVADERDAFDRQRDCWLGGVHLVSGQPMWTWNADRGRLEIREP